MLLWQVLLKIYSEEEVQIVHKAHSKRLIKHAFVISVGTSFFKRIKDSSDHVFAWMFNGIAF